MLAMRRARAAMSVAFTDFEEGMIAFDHDDPDFNGNVVPTINYSGGGGSGYIVTPATCRSYSSVGTVLGEPR
ncbi:Vespryn-21 [Frankliniella fusca]|uniref:Vespryn-21 n=1 Tax=Frankliniella fusca TaxID=407009 RepID=A0AAE1HBM5_9NEOP|nr:Vespryn-21 [Frankliniella fusca]